MSTKIVYVLILNNDSLTPWTNTNLVRVRDYPYLYYNDNRLNGHAISANASIRQFANVIKNMNLNFTFDYAIAIMKYNATFK